MVLETSILVLNVLGCEGTIASRPSQMTKQQYICIYNNLCLYTYVHIRQILMDGYSTKYSVGTAQIFQPCQKQKCPRNYHSHMD